MKRAASAFAGILILLVGCSSTTAGPPCNPDDREPNDSPDQARDLGDFTDDPDSSQPLTLTITSGGDQDFFRFRVFDKGLGGDPVVTVSAPEGYEVTTWFSCTRGAPKSFACSRGKAVTETDILPVEGCQNVQPSGSVSSSTDCDADSNDDGTVLVRIRRIDTSAACTDYSVNIEVE